MPAKPPVLNSKADAIPARFRSPEEEELERKRS